MNSCPVHLILFQEFLLFLLPLIPASSIRRNLTRLTTSITLTSISSHLPTTLHSILGVPREELHEPLQDQKKKHGKYWSLPLDQCAICAEAASFTLYVSEARNTFASASPPATSPSTSAFSQPHSAHTGTEAPACPLYIPYRASCGDVYCYHCLVECMLSAADDGEVWECLRCGERVRSADRFVIGTEIEHEWISTTSNVDAKDP
jgi:peroxin-2